MRVPILIVLLLLVVPVVIADYSSPYAYYSFENNTIVGTTLTDIAGTYDGTLYNTPAYTPGFLIDGREFLAGSQEYAILGSSTDFYFEQGTVSYWFKQGSYATLQFHISKAGVGSTDKNFMIYNNAGTLTANLMSGSSTTGTASSTDLNSVGEWNHVVVLWDGSILYLYINGEHKHNSSYSAHSYTAPHDTYIGRRSNSYGTFDIDELGFYDTNLSVSDIRTLYNNGRGHNPVTGLPGIGVFFSATANDAEVGTAINTFSLGMDGSSFSTTNGTIITNYSDVSGTFNITLSALGYFPRTYTHDLATNLSGELFRDPSYGLQEISTGVLYLLFGILVLFVVGAFFNQLFGAFGFLYGIMGSVYLFSSVDIELVFKIAFLFGTFILLLVLLLKDEGGGA